MCVWSEHGHGWKVKKRELSTGVGEDGGCSERRDQGPVGFPHQATEYEDTRSLGPNPHHFPAVPASELRGSDTCDGQWRDGFSDLSSLVLPSEPRDSTTSDFQDLRECPQAPATLTKGPQSPAPFTLFLGSAQILLPSQHQESRNTSCSHFTLVPR